MSLLNNLSTIASPFARMISRLPPGNPDQMIFGTSVPPSYAKATPKFAPPPGLGIDVSSSDTPTAVEPLQSVLRQADTVAVPLASSRKERVPPSSTPPQQVPVVWPPSNMAVAIAIGSTSSASAGPPSRTPPQEVPVAWPPSNAKQFTIAIESTSSASARTTKRQQQLQHRAIGVEDTDDVIAPRGVTQRPSGKWVSFGIVLKSCWREN